ncbi:MAG: hypothetical protein C0154_16010 [Mucilaginibacter sp.]|nr:MAG: hypothetical protein C0154_16010 [Mucilaginibacter sp.]
MFRLSRFCIILSGTGGKISTSYRMAGDADQIGTALFLQANFKKFLIKDILTGNAKYASACSRLLYRIILRWVLFNLYKLLIINYL